MSASSFDGSVAAATDQIASAIRTGTPCPPVHALLESFGVEGAYAVQDVQTRAALASGRRPIGRKIGLTSPSVQKQLGVDQPDYGMLFADMAVLDGEEMPAGRLLQPRVEAEIAFVLEHSLDRLQLGLTDVIGAVAYALPAIEIVDSRIADWRISLLDTIADNASSGAFVLGTTPRRIDGLDLRLCGMTLETRGEPVSNGCGAACLGHPLHALLWLARKMVEVGRPLVAGEVVLSGALGPMVPVAPGGVYEARISGLGRVGVAFAGEGHD
jgi:2-keto-4-pentenoate hydratase